MFEVSAGIAAPLQDAWTVLADVERWPEWTDSMSRVELIGGPLAVGSQVRIKQPRLPPVVWEVTNVDAGRAFSWEATSPGMTTVADHRLMADGPDRVTLTLCIQRSGPLASVADLVFGRLTRRYVEMEAEGFKRRCEAPT
jgi:uncharacterized membrane protein